MIPEEKKAAVELGLTEAFGVTEFEEIRMLTAGMSTALVFRIEVKGTAYLLRVITRTDVMSNPTRQFACMRKGAAAGIAPRVLYTSIEDRISITDFVETRPLARKEAIVRLPATIRTLHALPVFPKVVEYVAAVDGFIQKFQEAKILPESETGELFRSYARVQSIYPRNDSEMVASHNDLEPENILFDGEGVWLVDWEAAFLNDRYFDLAVVANFVVTNDADEESFLRAYFGEATGEYRMARFYLMRQIVHMSYAMVFLRLGAGGKALKAAMAAPGFREFHDGIWNGEISLVSHDMKVAYGHVHMEQALANMRTQRFEEALRIVADSQ